MSELEKCRERTKQRMAKPASVPLLRTLWVMSGGEVRPHSINYETHKIEVLAQNANAIVIKVHGHTRWAGNYMDRAYVSPEIYVGQILQKTVSKDGSVRYELEPLIEWDAGRQKK